MHCVTCLEDVCDVSCFKSFRKNQSWSGPITGKFLKQSQLRNYSTQKINSTDGGMMQANIYADLTIRATTKCIHTTHWTSHMNRDTTMTMFSHVSILTGFNYHLPSVMGSWASLQWIIIIIYIRGAIKFVVSKRRVVTDWLKFEHAWEIAK